MQELAKRNGKTGVFHIITFCLTVYISPMAMSHLLFCQILFLALLLGVAIRSYLCIPKVQQKYLTKNWYTAFYALTVFLYSVWSLWLSVNFNVLGLERATYFSSLLIAGLLSGGVMGFAPSRSLMITVILVTLLPPIGVLITLQTQEAGVMVAMFGLNGLYLLSLARQVNRDYSSAVVNRELTEQNRQAVEGVLHSVPGMVSCVDHQLNYVWTNKKLDKRFGINVTQGIKTLGAYSLNDQFPDFVKQFIQSGKEVDQLEYQMTFPDGPCWMMVFLSSYQEYGEGRVLIVAYDIQSMKLAELELEKQRLISMESAKLATLGEMSAGIAHEINNPLAVMMGRADMMIGELKKGTVTPDLLINNLEKIVKGSERIAKIVKGLKTFSRNGDKDEFQSVKVDTMVQDVLDFTREKFKHNSIELRVNIETDLSIDCRSTQIEQVLLNLLSNSFDAIAGSPEPWILVEGKVEGDIVAIAVTDSGPGIDQKLISKIMQPFYTTKEVGKGTGLGLSISLGIVKSHQGEFFYDGNSKNTRFVIRVPKKQKVAA